MNIINKEKWPRIIDLEMVNFCNLKCIFCHTAAYDFGPAQYIPLSLIKKLSPAFKQADSVTLFNRFEPLVHPQFSDSFSFVASHGCETYFSTNGVALTKDISTLLIREKLTYLTLSLSTLNPLFYRKLYGRDLFTKVINNIERLSVMKKEHNSIFPQLRLMMVFMADNSNEIFALCDLAKRLDFTEGLAVNFFITHSRSLLLKNPLSPENISTTRKTIKEAEEYADKIGIKFTIQAGSTNNLSADDKAEIAVMGHRKCPEPFKRASISYSGHVKACSVANEVLGDINQEDFFSIWHGDKFNTFRQQVNSENPPRSCKNCWHCRYGAHHINNDYTLHDKNIMGVPRKS